MFVIEMHGKFGFSDNLLEGRIVFFSYLKVLPWSKPALLMCENCFYFDIQTQTKLFRPIKATHLESSFGAS
jgi:hypothetical protein